MAHLELGPKELQERNKLAGSPPKSLIESEEILLGDFSKVRGLTNLQTLNLYKTQVTGDFSKMRALTNLQTLDLYKTQVTGEIDGLRALTNLERLYLSITQVQGDFSRMRALKNLQVLDQAARGVIVAQGLEHASLPAILLNRKSGVRSFQSAARGVFFGPSLIMKSAAGQGEPLSRVARLGL